MSKNVVSQKNVLYLKDPSVFWLDLADNFQTKFDWKPAVWLSSHGNTLLEQVWERGSRTYNIESANTAKLPDYLSGQTLCALDLPCMQALSRYQDVTFRMIERFSIDSNKSNYEALIFYYWRIARIWLTILRTSNIEIVICPTIPHRIVDYVVYILCSEVVNIPMLMFETGAEVLGKGKNRRIVGFPVFNLEDRSAYLLKNKLKVEGVQKISNEVKEHVRKIRGEYADARPLYLIQKGNRKLPARRSKSVDILIVLAKIVADFCRWRLFSKSGKLEFTEKKIISLNGQPQFASNLKFRWSHHQTQQKTKDAYEFYESNVVNYQDYKNYVFFVANFEPERTITPDAGIYGDMYLALAVLSESLPKDWVILYKEHPSSFRPPIRPDNKRTVSYYRRILSYLDNVHFLSTGVDSFSVIDHSHVVATLNGTAGWEARIRAKPVIIFGDVWYRHCHGVTKVTKVLDAKELISNIHARGSSNLSLVEPEIFLQNYLDNCFDFMPWFKDAKLMESKKNSNPDVYWGKIEATVTEYHRLYMRSLEYLAGSNIT